MYLENGRDLVRGIVILGFVAWAHWGNSTTAVVLLGVIGVSILQSAFTDWCPIDLVLRPIGLKKKREAIK